MISAKGKTHIIISRNIEDLVEIADLPHFSCHVEEDVIKKALSLIRKPRKTQLQLQLFISPEIVEDVDRALNDFSPDKIIYRITVISRDDKIPIGRLDSGSVVSLRQTKITSSEFGFLVTCVRDKMNMETVHRNHYSEIENILKDSQNDQEDLINIGKSLSLEKDPDKLLRTILSLSQKITGCDAGSIFLIEEDESGNKSLRFKYTNTFSLKDAGKFEEFTMPLDTNSIAGYVGVTGNVLNINDVYLLSSNDPVSFNKSYDVKTGYRTKSMLVVPMVGNQDRLIGVIQLINSKESAVNGTGEEAVNLYLETADDFENKVSPFHKRYESLMEAVAGQAAISLENSRMFRQIEFQFEEFVKASVTAIESRDPATSGHSFRVASMCVSIAKAINADKNGPFADVSFSDVQLKELEFAALLHDFGKVYIDASVFLKAKKLFPEDYALLKMRLNFLHRSIELKYSGSADGIREKKLEEINRIIELISQLNEPSVQAEDPEETIRKICGFSDDLSCVDLEGNVIPLLTEKEHVNLSIKKGSLNKEERKIIESHVNHTYTFVSRIPWPAEYRNIPEFSVKHHEMLDGSGYPHGISAEDGFPIQARMMGVADIFDALSASDRPYKKSMPIERICRIMNEEADIGKLDADIVELFIREKLWEDDK